MLLFKVRPRKSPTATAALTPSERRMMRVIGEAMLKVRRQVIRDETEILYAIEHGTAAKVSSLISVDPWLDIQETIQEELFTELVSGGQRVKLPTIRKEVLSYRFDATRPEASNWASKEAGTLIRGIGEEQVNLVREYVSQASMGDYTPRQVARNLRDVIGLTSAQAGWVENFRNRQISEQMSTGKSYDQAYAASEKSTERYHSRIHRYRTETIARTEILRASHEGRRESWQQGIEEGFISAGASKQWSTELDGRECEICAPLDGETVLIGADFSDGEPPIHPNCRCDVLLVDSVDADLEGLTGEQLDAIIDDLLTVDSLAPTESEGTIDTVNQGFEDYSNEPQKGTEDWLGPENLSESERLRAVAAVAEYQNTFATSINRHLRDKETLYSDEKQTISVLDKLIKKSGGLGKDTTLWRGFIWDADMKISVGRTIRTPGYTSTSYSRTVAEDFTNKGKGWLMQLEASAGTKGFAMNALSPNVGGNLEKEHEYVLPRNAKLKVVSVDADSRVIRVEVLPDAIRKAAVKMPLLPRPNDDRFVGYASDYLVETN